VLAPTRADLAVRGYAGDGFGHGFPPVTGRGCGYGFESCRAGADHNWRFGAAWRKGGGEAVSLPPARRALTPGRGAGPPSHADKRDAMGGQS